MLEAHHKPYRASNSKIQGKKRNNTVGKQSESTALDKHKRTWTAQEQREWGLHKNSTEKKPGKVFWCATPLKITTKKKKQRSRSKTN